MFYNKLNKKDFSTSVWSGGTTTQLFIYPENSNYNNRDFQARISSATVELEESNFTKLVGIHRFISPLSGNLRLTHNGKTFVDLKPFEVYEFDGGRETKSYGKAKDFNLMLADGTKGELKHISIEEDKFILFENGINVLYSYDSTVIVQLNKEEVILGANEILVIKTKMSKLLKLQSQENANLFLSRITVDF